MKFAQIRPNLHILQNLTKLQNFKKNANKYIKQLIIMYLQYTVQSIHVERIDLMAIL